MKHLAKIFHSKKDWLPGLALGIVLVGVFVLIKPVFALNSIEQSVLTVLGWITVQITNFLGNVLLILIEILIGVFNFSEFIDTPAVDLGWVVIRDIANMAIVVSLIIIAFSTVLKVQSFVASKMLTKLVVAAILVNFSKLIAGFLIDFGQVLMMTFVNGFRDLAAGNLVVGFGIEDMLKIATSDAGQQAFDTASLVPVVGSMLLAIVMLAVAIGVILAFVALLVQRVVVCVFFILYQ